MYAPSPRVTSQGNKPGIAFHSGQMHDACTVPAIILQRKIQTNVASFTLAAKLNIISENLSFLLWACVQNEVITGIHKF